MQHSHLDPGARRILLEYKDILRTCPLFDDIPETDMIPLVACIAPTTRSFDRGEIILSHGQRVQSIGIVLEGEVEVAREDAAGNRHLIGRLLPSDLYAETLVCAGVDHSPVTVSGVVPGKVLLFDFNRLVNPCSNVCDYHRSLITNMLRILAQKNLQLSDKLDFLSRRSIRAKIASYLLSRMEETGTDEFTVPFDRNGLAEFLSCDRSALSRELGNMRSKGILQYQKNRFAVMDAHTLAKWQS